VWIFLIWRWSLVVLGLLLFDYGLCGFGVVSRPFYLVPSMLFG